MGGPSKEGRRIMEAMVAHLNAPKISDDRLQQLIEDLSESAKLFQEFTSVGLANQAAGALADTVICLRELQLKRGFG